MPIALSSVPRSVLALLGLAGLASAQSDEWRFHFGPYLWATDVGIDTTLDGRTVVDEIIQVQDLIDDLETTFQGRFELQHGAFGALLDVFYVSMADEVHGLELPQGAGTAELDWTLDMTVADLAATYDPRGDGLGVSFLAGVRVLDQRAEVDAQFTTGSGTSVEHYEASETLFDALVGLRFREELGGRVAVETQLDVSTGDTDHTWSVFPALTWSFGGGEVMAGYRHLEVDFEQQGGLDTELSLSGPLLGLRFSL